MPEWFTADGVLMCKCGHIKSRHYYGTKCTARVQSHVGPDYECICEKFKEAKLDDKSELSK